MAGKATDRKKAGKEPKPVANEAADTLAAFTLPDSLSCSEVEFPVLMTRSNKASWRQILEESEQRMREIQEYADSKKEPIIKAPFLKTQCDYIKDEIFVHLLPTLTDTLNKAKIWEALLRQKCFFNGIDHISQVLWNNNPRYPDRKHNNLHLFNMPWVRDYLKKKIQMLTNDTKISCGSDGRNVLQDMEFPRPYYPKSWLWPEDYAATVIQKTVRQYFVQREDEVQEMREFWKKLVLERDVCPEMDTNPFLAKKFASASNFRK